MGKYIWDFTNKLHRFFCNASCFNESGIVPARPDSRDLLVLACLSEKNLRFTKE